MYIILTYDIEQKRVGKMLKLCRRYLHWVQNSVFEGEITESKLKELIAEAKRIIDVSEDHVMIYKSRQKEWLEKEILGTEKVDIGVFL